MSNNNSSPSHPSSSHTLPMELEIVSPRPQRSTIITVGRLEHEARRWEALTAPPHPRIHPRSSRVSRLQNAPPQASSSPAPLPRPAMVSHPPADPAHWETLPDSRIPREIACRREDPTRPPPTDPVSPWDDSYELETVDWNARVTSHAATQYRAFRPQQDFESETAWADFSEVCPAGWREGASHAGAQYQGFDEQMREVSTAAEELEAAWAKMPYDPYEGDAVKPLVGPGFYEPVK